MTGHLSKLERVLPLAQGLAGTVLCEHQQMAELTVSSLVLFAADHAGTAAFYRAVGLPLEDEDHDDGPVHHAAEVGGIHVAIYPAESEGGAPARRGAGSTFAGFYVESLDEVLSALEALGAPVLTTHEEMPWGCRFVAADPDGRPVEVNQRGHCADI